MKTDGLEVRPTQPSDLQYCLLRMVEVACKKEWNFLDLRERNRSIVPCSTSGGRWQDMIGGISNDGFNRRISNFALHTIGAVLQSCSLAVLLSCFPAFLLSCCLAPCLLSGCAERIESQPAGSQESNDFLSSPTQSRDVFDAGIIFQDQSSYLCVPTSKLGIEKHDVVVAASSSCECMRPSIVRFLATSGEIEEALRVDFVAEQIPQGAALSPMQLGIEVTLTLRNGTEKTVRFDLLHTASP